MLNPAKEPGNQIKKLFFATAVLLPSVLARGAIIVVFAEGLSVFNVLPPRLFQKKCWSNLFQRTSKAQLHSHAIVAYIKRLGINLKPRMSTTRVQESTT